MKIRKAKVKLDFNISFLDSLIEDETSCVVLETRKHHLGLHPYHLNDINQSIKDILNIGLYKYDLKLDGILFGYKNTKLISNLGAIIDDACFIHVDVEADFFIFKPEVGKRLQGVVNKTSKDHVGCLVHELFNVSIPKNEKHWIGQALPLTSVVDLEITTTNFDQKLPYIRGKIINVLFQPEAVPDEVKATKLRFDEDGEVEGSIQEEVKSPKKKKKKHSVSEVNDDEAESNLAKSPKKKKKIKKESESEKMETPKKRKRSLTEEVEISIQEEKGLEEFPPKKKRKKSHKSQTEDNRILQETSEILEQISKEVEIKSPIRKRKKSKSEL